MDENLLRPSVSDTTFTATPAVEASATPPSAVRGGPVMNAEGERHEPESGRARQPSISSPS
ncbi:hypothetical protein ACIBCT_31545 [Streptosporangium sp. NPDC050855]|uniref:hypothetical protein n=1 Tax=Streptosporangium sp. NPDC050855 TaxID=3366194 RepID=UPI00378D4533